MWDVNGCSELDVEATDIDGTDVEATKLFVTDDMFWLLVNGTDPLDLLFLYITFTVWDHDVYMKISSKNATCGDTFSIIVVVVVDI